MKTWSLRGEGASILLTPPRNREASTPGGPGALPACLAWEFQAILRPHCVSLSEKSEDASSPFRPTTIRSAALTGVPSSTLPRWSPFSTHRSSCRHPAMSLSVDGQGAERLAPGGCRWKGEGHGEEREQHERTNRASAHHGAISITCSRKGTGYTGYFPRNLET
jgi:hypothetical protein